jgi:sulfatase maturation enzyme AslB (radical SAM superfamily)
MPSSPFCARPWASLLLYPDRAGPECALSNNYSCAIREKSLNEIWNSEALKGVRRAVLDNQAEKLGCWECEHFGSGTDFYDELLFLNNSIEAEKNLKINKDEFLNGKIVLNSKPLSLSADLWYKCNFRCIMCDLIHEGSEMDSKVYTNLFNEYTKTAVHLHVSGGEPLLHSGFARYLTSPNTIPSALSITTNGSLLNRTIQNNLKQFYNVNLHISIDSFDQNIFSRMRPGSQYSKIMANLNQVVRIKNKIRKGKDDNSWYICIQFLPCAINVNEFPAYIRRAADMGIDAIHVCEIAGEHPQYDFAVNPDLLNNIAPGVFADEIKSAMSQCPELEFSGTEKLISTLKHLSVKSGKSGE